MHKKTKAALDRIVDTCSGADGGVSVVKLKMMIEDMDRQATEGDRAAQKIIDILTRFAALVDVANKL